MAAPHVGSPAVPRRGLNHPKGTASIWGSLIADYTGHSVELADMDHEIDAARLLASAAYLKDSVSRHERGRTQAVPQSRHESGH